MINYNKLTKYTIPFRVAEPGKTEFISEASCIILNLHQPVLLTAAHALPQCFKNEIVLPTKKTYETCRIPIKDCRFGFEEVSLDVTAIELPKNCLDLPDENACLPTNMIDIYHNFSPSSKYMIAGYPSSKNKLKPKNQKKLLRYSPVTYHLESVSESEMEELESLEQTQKELVTINRSQHIVCVHNLKNSETDGKKCIPPSLQGVSGGPIWDTNCEEPKFVGVFIEQRAKYRFSPPKKSTDFPVVGTKIEHVIQAIRRNLPSSCSDLPCHR